MFKDRKLLVTGGTGSIGNSICKYFNINGCKDIYSTTTNLNKVKSDQDYIQFKEKNPIGKFIPLNVSAPFHSDLMKDSAKIFSEKIKNNIFKKINIDLISNHKLVNYKEISEKDYSNQLSLQIHSPVMWAETIKTILNEDINTFIEIGPKKTLLNFLPKDFQGDRYSFCSIEDIENV